MEVGQKWKKFARERAKRKNWKTERLLRPERWVSLQKSRGKLRPHFFIMGGDTKFWAFLFSFKMTKILVSVFKMPPQFNFHL